ncbi:HNH endonuclease [Flagellimonas hymeniacidonis]|uniref:HNH endonuclease n=1 Tax=Flagellimonas hymeniacidonis TaxID=2603628 RepID=A0A5C8V7Q5_9FLAO|nr:HNH endonuclease [Flagellimonas hymeniacidonis]TXN37742.1 HNH endonuclease [Flagellimonas hymeniacidonis]
MTEPKKKTINNNMRRTCFFCSEIIEDKKTQEHIIPDSLLGKLGIKEETVTGKGVFQYSRVKVPAHKDCNSNFGSEYENEILKLLDEPEKLFEEIKKEESGISIIYSPDNSSTSLISTWLSKIYYGLFYNDYLKIDDLEHKETAEKIINTDNFRMIQNAYKDGVGFCLPSSLYVFESDKDFFDLRTFVYPKMIMIKIKKMVFILAIEDGFLTKNYLNEELLSDFRKGLLLEEQRNDKFPLHLYALAEIMALRMCIPKTPSFVYSKKEIMNMSLSTGVKNPEEYYKVDEELIAETRNEILESFNVKIK